MDTLNPYSSLRSSLAHDRSEKRLHEKVRESLKAFWWEHCVPPYYLLVGLFATLREAQSIRTCKLNTPALRGCRPTLNVAAK